MSKNFFILLVICCLAIALGSCRGPRYYTRYKLRNKEYDQHYNPYHRKWYKWGFQHGAI